MKKTFILFDFDGVIADTFRPAFAVNKMMCPNITEDDYRKRMDGNINDWKNNDPTTVHTDDCRHDLDFFPAYAAMMKKEARIVPAMKETVIGLENNHNLVIISSSVTDTIRAFLDEHGIADRFMDILGNDVHESKVEKIKMVFEKHGIGAGDCVFITDTLGDLREASSANVGAIGVAWEFQAPETLRKGSPFKIVEKPSEIARVVTDYFHSKK